MFKIKRAAAGAGGAGGGGARAADPGSQRTSLFVLPQLEGRQRFTGETRWVHLASDSGAELSAAARRERMMHLSSTRYRPESNGLIEREVGLLGQGIRTLLS